MKTKPVNDMYFCAALLNYGMELDKIDAENKNRMIFHFIDMPVKVWKKDNEIVSQVELLDLDQVELLYQSDRLMFLPTYHDSVRKMKSIIHSKKKVIYAE